MKITKMRIPTDAEYDTLCTITAEDDAKMHWKENRTFVSRNARGYCSARDLDEIMDTFSLCSFRPAFETVDWEELPTDVFEGKEPTVIGTLYMGAPCSKMTPVCITNGCQKPAYIAGTGLVVGTPIDDPAYQIRSYHVGNGVFVADRGIVDDLTQRDCLYALGVLTYEAFALEQSDDFSGRALQKFVKGLPKEEKYIPLYAEGVSSSGICFLNSRKLDSLTTDEEQQFLEKFRIELVKVLNDKSLEPADHICDLNGVRTFLSHS